MKTSKSKKKSKQHGGGVEQAQQFLIWHGEKIVTGIFLVVAVWFVLGALGHQTVSWVPNELVTMANETRNGIDESTRNAEDEGIKVSDHASHAEQIREPIRADGYSRISPWHPPFGNIPSAAP